MKKNSLVAVGVLMLGVLALGLLGGCGGSEPATTTTVTFPTGDTGVNWPEIAFTNLKTLGKGKVDVDAWRGTEAAETMMQQMGNTFLFKNEMDPAVLAYWDGLGMKKEMHDAGDPDLKWASYTPTAALAAGNTKVYPVVFDFVGGEKIIFYAEGHGVALLGATKGYITVCPANPVANGTTTITPGGQVTRILDALEAQGYPIDRSRVYVVGMSLGGKASALAGLEIPKVVAAVAMHSSLLALDTQDPGPEAIFGFIPESNYTQIMDYSVPMLAFAGQYDFDQLPLRTAGILNGLNLWLQADGCPTRLTLEDSLAAQASSTDPAVKLIGIVGDKTWTEDIGGLMYHGVEFNRADGVKMVEVVGVENLPHWVSPAFAELAWDFMSRFSRDAQGNLVVAK